MTDKGILRKCTSELPELASGSLQLPLGIHPSMVRNKTINQGKGNRVISILYFCDSIFLNCLGKLYVKVKVRVLILYFMFEHLILIK